MNVAPRRLGSSAWVVGVSALALAGAAGSAAGAQVDLSGIGHVDGDPDAPVAVVEFSDFACSACAEFFRETLGEVRAQLIDSGRVVWRQIPFTLGFRRGEEATLAAECAAEQGAFWTMHDALFRDPGAWIRARRPDDVFIAHARGMGLDTLRFETCYEARDPDGRIAEANAAARRLGLRATPAFFIDGHLVLGALPFAEFLRLVEAAESRRLGNPPDPPPIPRTDTAAIAR